MSETKQRIRVKAVSAPRAVAPAQSMTPALVPQGSQYLRDTRSSVISTRNSPLTESRDNIRRSWRRVAGIAQDLIMNSGRLSGAMDQIISDTVGSELKLEPKPDPLVLSRLGYDDTEITALCDLIKREWKYWSWNPKECDWRGKLTVPQMVDIGLRQFIAFGEVTGVLPWMNTPVRRRYGIATGTKVLMLAPGRLVQDTNEMEGLFQGVYHDENGRPVQYLFSERSNGFVEKRPWRALNGTGLPAVMHLFDPKEADDVRGISPLVGAIRKHIQHEMLADATLQQAVLQTSLAVALTSNAPSQDAFEALQELKDSQNGEIAAQLAESFMALYTAQISKAMEGTVSFGTDPKISHLAPGETLDVKTPSIPGPQFDKFDASLSRDMARALGVTYASLTMDSRGITYSSGRMDTSYVYPVTLRRRERISGPQNQMIYENFLDEKIATGTIPFKGGYEAFLANRDRLLWAQWRGPAKPSADDYKSARAANERIGGYHSSVRREAAEAGVDYEELQQEQLEEHNWYVDHGMTSPYAPKQGGAPAADEPDDDERDNRDETKGSDA